MSTEITPIIDTPSLDAIAAEINAAHERAHAAARTAIEHAVECGGISDLPDLVLLTRGEWPVNEPGADQ